MKSEDSTLNRLKEQEREVRRDLIVDAAMRLFARQTFNRVGMRDIAAEAGISPASIYRYFADRDELFLEVLFRESASIVTGFEQMIATDTGASIDEFAEAFVSFLIERDSLFQMMTHFMMGGDLSDEALVRFNATERKILDMFDKVFQNLGMHEEVRLTSHAFFAGLNGILITFRNYPGRESRETRRHMLRIARLMAKIFRNGVR